MKFYRRVLTPSFLLTIAFLLLRSSGTAHAEMILNGSFELPALTAGSITDFTLGQTIGQGWIVGGQNNVRLLNNPGAPNGVQQLAFLPFPSNIFQDIPLLSSSTDYRVNFQMSAFSTFAPGNLTVDILRNGNTLGSQAFSQLALAGTSDFEYASKSFTFRTSDAGMYRIQFTGGTFTPTYLDAVSLTAVPEPSTVVALSTLLCMFGFRHQRRKRRRPLSVHTC